MGMKIKKFLLRFDFIGLIPQFRILGRSRYKSIFSSILSIFIIFFTIAFSLYSLYEYINQKPNVEYYKNNDYSTNKTFVISDSLLMFKYTFFCSIDYSMQHSLEINSVDQYNYIRDKFQFEKCELGKNIDIKYSEVIKKFELTEDKKVEDYFCINYNNTNLTLYSHPFIYHEKENYLHLEIKTDCENFVLAFNLVTQNDFIDHNNKEKPIVPHYQMNNISTPASHGISTTDIIWVNSRDEVENYPIANGANGMFMNMNQLKVYTKDGSTGFIRDFDLVESEESIQKYQQMKQIENVQFPVVETSAKIVDSNEQGLEERLEQRISSLEEKLMHSISELHNSQVDTETKKTTARSMVKK